MLGKSHEGRAEIKAFMEKAQAPERRGKHVTTSSIIDVNGDEARVFTDYFFIARTDDGFVTPTRAAVHFGELLFGRRAHAGVEEPERPSGARPGQVWLARCQTHCAAGDAQHPAEFG